MTFKIVLKNNTRFSNIIIEIYDNKNKVKKLDTSLTITREMWDETKQCPKNIYLKKLKKLNFHLDRIKIVVTNHLNDVKLKKKKLSLLFITKRINNITSLDYYSYKEGSLLYYTNYYINSREHLISKITYKRYKVFFRLLERFEGYAMKNFLISDVNSDFVKRFIKFAEQELYSTSTIHRTIYFVRTILNFLEKREIRTFVYELELPKEKKYRKCIITLDENELATIRNTKIPDELKSARDWLVISCYLGQRVSDFMNFETSMLQTVQNKKYISFTQQKTGKNILLPLHPIVLLTLSKNNGFPLKLSFEIYNKQIKEVVKLAGINDLVKIRKRTGFRSQFVLINKWKVITSHIGRRSFASNFYGKIPTPLLMDATGHSTEQMFNKYICNLDKERAKDLGTYFDEIYRSKNVL